MRIYEQTETKRIESKLKSEICDCCHAAIQRWCNYDYNKTALFVETGFSYPEHHSSTTFQADICVNCFKTKIIPLLTKELNVKFYETETDF